MKKIALIMDEWKRYFTYAWPSGILQRIHECNAKVNLYIFSSSGNWSWDREYNIGEYNIYRLPDFKEFDGIILDLNNIVIEEVRQEVIQKVKASGVPVITIGCEIEDFYYVGIDNYSAMYQIIEHMHKIHGCQNYWFVMGPKDNYESSKRTSALKDYMREHQISFSEEDFYYGSFEYSCGLEGFEALYASHEELPDTIICANDNIAVGVGEASSKHGLRIPEDIRITGFDNFDKASIYRPNITTVSHIREDVGIFCADLFLKLWAGEVVDRHYFTKSNAIYWESCGCGQQAQIDIRKNLKDRMMYDIETAEFEETVLLLEYELGYCKTIPDIMNCIAKFVSSFKCDAMYLVMDERIHAYKKQADLNQNYQSLSKEGFLVEGYPEHMQLQFAYENGKRIDVSDMPAVEGIFPIFDYEKAGRDFLFLPLHFGKCAIGYFVIRNAVYLLEQQYLFEVMGVLTKAIENLHKKEKLEYLNAMLSKLSVHDAMTGLYNRMGYMKFGNEFMANEHKMGHAVSVFFVDLDRLKEINDRFGHEYGDFAIIAVSKAIRKYCDQNSIVARIGGDEYIILQRACTEMEEEQLEKNIRNELREMAEQMDFCVPLTVSIGSVVTDPALSYSMEEYVRHADEKMYKEKVEKKVNRK